MRVFLFSLCSLFIMTSAYADCMSGPDRQTEVKIDKISSPVYDPIGSKVNGCILHSKGKVLGYTREARLCQSAVGSNLKVRLSYGCCDTGPDAGEIACIIRSKPSLGISQAHGNGVTIYSAIAP